MLKKAVLYTSVALTALTVTAGCANGDSTTTTSATAPSFDPAQDAGAPAAAPEGADGSAPADQPSGADSSFPADQPAETRTSDPGDTTLPEGIGDDGVVEGLDADADWARMVTACPDKRQEVIIHKVVTADVNGDGSRDAVVARSCESITSYWPSTVEIIDGLSQPSKPRRLGVLLTDVGPTDRPWFKAMRVAGGEVTVEAIGSDADGSSSCADLSFTYRYRFGGGKFGRVARDVGNANECQRIG